MSDKLVRPVIEPYQVTSPYGERIINGKKEFHTGIDYVNQNDDRRLVSIANGIVFADKDNYNHAKRYLDPEHSVGNFIILQHIINGKDYFSYYFHVEENYVSKDDVVEQGQIIGKYGDVGYGWGAHLHFEIRNAYFQRFNFVPLMIDGLKANGLL
mgnify:CR=1 FL=1